MKKKFNTYVLIFASLIALHACCSKEALLDISEQKFIFLDQSTHENLLFGTSAKYNKDSIYISYNNGLDYQKINISNNLLDSIITIDFNFKDTCLLKFSNNDIDTFILKYEDISKKTSAGSCKLAATVLKSIKFNNTTYEPNYNQPIKIYK